MSCRNPRDSTLLDSPVQPEFTFGELIEKARAGCDNSANTLYELYYSHVIRLIRREFLTPCHPLRRDLDSADLAQLAWASAFEEIKKERPFDNAGEFLEFLLAITRNCCRNEIRTRVTAQKRSINRETQPGLTGEDPASNAEGPAESVALDEEWQFFLCGLAPADRPAVEWFSDGYTVNEIAERLGTNVRWVQRVIALARKQWAARCAGGGVSEERGLRLD